MQEKFLAQCTTTFGNEDDDDHAVNGIGKLPRLVHDDDQDEDDQDHAGKESWHSSLRHLLMMMIITMQKWYRLLEDFIVQ